MKHVGIVGVCLGLFYGSASVHAESTQVIILQQSELLERANNYLETGETIKAKEMLERVLTKDLTPRQRANAHNSMCVAFIKEEQWRFAMNHCDAAIELVKYNWRYYNNRGNIFLGLGQGELALAEYNKALKLAPSSTTLQTNIAIAQDRLALTKNQHKSIEATGERREPSRHLSGTNSDSGQKSRGVPA